MDATGGYEEYAFVAEFYDSVVPYSGRADVAFFVEMARASSGSVLEVGCGIGRVLIPTARARMEIVGLDLSTRMLSICRDKLALEPEPIQSRVRLVHEDMRRFELGREFGLATIPFRPFQLLTTVDDQLSDGRRVVGWERTVSRDLFNQVQGLELIYYVTHPDGREERLVHSFQMRHLFRYEAEHLLARSGFQLEDLYADYDKSPYGSKQPGELIFVARKV